MRLPTEPCLSPFMAYRKCAGQRGMEPPNSHCSSGGKYKDRERGASLLGCTGCCPIHTPLFPPHLFPGVGHSTSGWLPSLAPHPSLLVTCDLAISLLLAGVAVGQSAQEVASGVRQSQTEPQPPLTLWAPMGPWVNHLSLPLLICTRSNGSSYPRELLGRHNETTLAKVSPQCRQQLSL